MGVSALEPFTEHIQEPVIGHMQVRIFLCSEAFGYVHLRPHFRLLPNLPKQAGNRRKSFENRGKRGGGR